MALGVEDYGAYISFGATFSFCGMKHMTPVFHQRNLDSCIPCTLSSLLGALYVVENPTCLVAPEFSRQEMVDCLSIGQSGTFFEYGYGYICGRGLHTEEEYPYLNKYNSFCRCLELRGRPKISFQFHEIIPDQHPMIDYLIQQPLSAGMFLYRSFEQYHYPFKSALDLLDVYSPEPGEQPYFWPNRNPKCHAILVIGYGIVNGKEFYIIKNSGGVYWGANGYARVTPNLLFCWGRAKGISVKQL